MQLAPPAPLPLEEHHAARRPTGIDVLAALLLLAAVALHIAGMGATYYVIGSSHQSLFSQPYQAAPAAVLTAVWAVALIVGLLGPDRLALSAAIAVGAAVTEMGLRQSDLGEVWSGSAKGGLGLWLTTAGWAAGALAALAILAAARRRSSLQVPALLDFAPVASSADTAGGGVTAPAGSRAEWVVDWTSAAPGTEEHGQPAPEAEGSEAEGPEAGDGGGGDHEDGVPVWTPPADLVGEATDPTSEPPDVDPDSTVEVASVSLTDSTVALAVRDDDPGGVPPELLASRSGDTSVFQAIPDEDPGSRAAWTTGVVLLALVTAGAFLPAWDRFTLVSATAGQSVSYTRGNAFDAPWQLIVGNVMVAVAVAVVPIVAVRLRRRAVGAALTLAMIAVLATQFVSAVIQLDTTDVGVAVSASTATTSKLTGWFALDILAAFALVVVVVVRATAKTSHENSVATFPKTPNRRSDSIPWTS